LREKNLSRNNLLDLNVLIALTEPGHTHHLQAQQWFDFLRLGQWGICPLTEAGFIRVTANPRFHPGPHTVAEAIAILQALKKHPDFRYWAIAKSWVDLTARFAKQIVGHQQVTDAYLLGLAADEDDVLITFDKGMRQMAGPELHRNVFVIE